MAFPYPHVYTPITIRGVHFKNRLFSNPIGIWTVEPQNSLGDYGVALFAEKAKGGMATVTYGDQQVNQGEPGEDTIGPSFPLRAYTSRALLGEMADAVHRHGAVASMELAHSGIFRAPGEKVDATAGPPDPTTMKSGPEVMSEELILETIRQYADCAASLKAAGFKMCLLHCAHNKLPEQFFLKKWNPRTDRWGGSLENRMRFILEITSAVRKAVGENFVIEVRVSGRDPETDPERFEELAQLCERLKGIADIINVSRCDSFPGSPIDSLTMPVYLYPTCYNTFLADKLKQRVGDGILFAATGAIIDVADAEKILAENRADLIGVARATIADPDWARKYREGREDEVRPCIGCMKCLNVMHASHNVICSVNARVGREHVVPKRVTAPVSRKVAVVGGGPAGLTAAITAAEMGHQVTVYEKADRLGGILASFAPDDMKYRLNNYRDYLIREAERVGVKVRLNTEVNKAMMEAEAPDAILLATGSAPIIPKIPGTDLPNVYTSLNAHDQLDSMGHRVVVVGGNLSGCELAASLQQHGHEVTLLEMTPRLHAGAYHEIIPRIDQLLQPVHCMTETKCTGVTETGVTAEKNGETVTIPADAVVFAVGMRPVNALADELRFVSGYFAEIGDCLSVGTVMEATRTAYYAARDIE